MNRAQILSKLQKVFGKNAGVGYRIDDKAPDAEERERYRDGHASARLEANAARDARRARAEWLLSNDAEYQRLKADEKAKTERADRIASNSHRYRITVTTSSPSSMFAHVQAQGDTWPEVFAKLEKKS